MADSVQAAAQKRHRSPAYPGISLGTALERARSFYAVERRNAANVSVVAKHWKLSAKSSGALVTFAAMGAFGLMESAGNGDQRTLKLSDLALRILLDERTDSLDRKAAIKTAALRPKIHQQLWSKWGASLPSDENFKHALIFDWKFNENSITDFINEYKSTISFAGLSDSDVVSASEDDKEQMATPTVEQSRTGADMATTKKQTANSEMSDRLARTQADVYAHTYNWPLSKEVNAHVSISGDGLKPSHIDMLKKYLDLVKSALETDGN